MSKHTPSPANNQLHLQRTGATAGTADVPPAANVAAEDAARAAAVEAANAAAAAVQASADAATAAQLAAAADEKPKYPERARLVTKSGRMLHLFTGHWFDTEPGKKVDVDAFVVAQLDAGKLFISVED